MHILRNCISCMLAFCLLLSGALALAEAATAPAAGDAPVTGDVIEGFEVLETREFALIGAQIMLFEHQRTGAKLMYIANEDTNRVFDLTFLTRPTDNTGLPHVFEHSTLDGSEKYPSKALFFNLSYQTYNTYMNASTYSVMTTYPVASLSEAQLLKYADFYTDSCLHPIIMEDESIFREEAWRYRMASMDDPLTIEGTVYSEMLGATTLSRAAMMNAYRAAFPGSAVGLDQGGDPDYIPEMTWDSLKNYHNLFYHPSNCIAFLYGQFDDYTAFLRLLNDAFAPYEKAEFTYTDSGYTPITAPVEVSQGFPMEAGSSTENQSTVYYYIVCPGLRDDAHEQLVMNTLTDLLVTESSAMSLAVRRALPTADFATYIDDSAPDDAIVFVASSVNPEDAAVFKATIDQALAEIAETGFAADMVDAAMASLSLSTKLVMEDAEVGVGLIPNIAYSYATSGNPFAYMDYTDALSSIEDWNAQGLYQAGIKKWLIGSQTTALVTTYPEPGQKEANDEALRARLAEIKAQMSEDELNAIIARTNAEATDDAGTADMVASLQAVDVSSLPEEIRLYDVTDETGEDTVRRVNAVADVDGIGRVSLFLDASGLTQEELHWFKLFTQLLGELDTSAHTLDELALLSDRYLYGREIRASLLGNEEAHKPYLRMGWTGTDEDLAAGYDLMYEIVFETDFSDPQKLLEKISSVKTSLRTTINGAPYQILLYRALSVTNPLYRLYNYMNFLEYYAFLEQVEAAMQTSPDAVIEALRGIQSALKNRTQALVAFAGNEESIALNAPLADAFLARLGDAPIEAAAYDLPVPAKREGLIVDTQVQYNALIADFATLGMPDGYHGSLNALAALVEDVFLVPGLRDAYGVYAPWCGSVDDGGFYLLTYRDPNIVETFDVYDGLADQLAQYQIEKSVLDGYVMSAYSQLSQSSGELTGAIGAAVSILNGDPQDLRLKYMRELKTITPEAVTAASEMFRKLSESGIRSTAGSAAMINENADRYDVILNPFNAQDASQVTLTDVPEDAPWYADVRYAFENGLMLPVSEDAFGPENTATISDLYMGLYVLIGGGQDAEEAYAALTGYGLVPADYAPDTELTYAMNEEILAGFMLMATGEPMPEEAKLPADQPDAAMTRAALAAQLRLLNE